VIRFFLGQLPESLDGRPCGPGEIPEFKRLFERFIVHLEFSPYRRIDRRNDEAKYSQNQVEHKMCGQKHKF
jgi:hypothetical protein